jgi:hypothetical protein
MHYLKVNLKLSKCNQMDETLIMIPYLIIFFRSINSNFISLESVSVKLMR